MFCSLLAQNTAEHSIRLNLNEVSLVDVEPMKSIVLALKPPREPGSKLSSCKNTTKWINYSTSMKRGGVSRNISVQIDGDLPAGVLLNLETKEYVGNGEGKFGYSVGKKVLSGTPIVIIYDIGACYTGSGVHSGHNLVYSLGIEDYDIVESVSSYPVVVVVVVVIYTISQ
jgi:hypothetical protein